MRTRPPNPHNNKPGRPIHTTTNNKIKIQQKSPNYSKMRGSRPPNKPDRPSPTNNKPPIPNKQPHKMILEFFEQLFYECAGWGTSGGSCDAKVKCIVDV